MSLNVSTNDVELTDKLLDLLHEKLDNEINKYLQNYPEDIKRAEINIKRDSRWGFSVTFDLNVPGQERIFAETKEKELHSAINKLRADISRQLRKYKEKRAHK